MSFNPTRSTRRIAAAASGLVAAATLVAGAGPASADFPLKSTLNDPTTVVCDGSTQCKVHDSDGILQVTRYDGNGTAVSTGYAGKHDITVYSEGKYTSFRVTDMRLQQKFFSLINPG